MNPAGVVVVELQVESSRQLTYGLEPIRVSKINLELVVERLLVAIFPRASLGAHGELDAKLGRKSGVQRTLVFASLVRVADQGSPVFLECVNKCSEHELHRVSRQHAPANN